MKYKHINKGKRRRARRHKRKCKVLAKLIFEFKDYYDESSIKKLWFYGETPLTNFAWRADPSAIGEGPYTVSDERWFRVSIGGLKMLEDNRIDINFRKGKTDSALHLACHNKNHILVSMLIDNGAEINILNRFNKTPLHKGISCPKCLCLLLDNGADINIKSNKGLTPLSELFNKMKIGYFSDGVKNSIIKSLNILFQYNVISLTPDFINEHYSRILLIYKNVMKNWAYDGKKWSKIDIPN